MSIASSHRYSSDEIKGDNRDVIRVVKEVMNKATSNRLISKQECVVLLADLDLVKCTEQIESLSVSNSHTVEVEDGKIVKKGSPFLKQYATRPIQNKHCSLHQYFIMTHPGVIPHFVGINGQPTYPISESFAKQVVVCHVPWNEYPKSNTNWKDVFHNYFHSDSCSKSVRMTYERVLQRHIKKMTYYEPVAAKIDHSKNPMTQAAQELLDLYGKDNITDLDAQDKRLLDAPKGELKDWSQYKQVSSKGTDSFRRSENVYTVINRS